MSSSSTTTHARDFAIQAHGGQRYGEHPYEHHLDAVVALLGPHGDDAQVTGYLHDVVEDTTVPLDRIEAEFGLLVRNCVALLTDEPGADRAEKKERTHAKLAQVAAGSPEALALIVKAADRLANLRECATGIARGDERSARKLARYRTEHAAFRAAVHRQGLCEEWWSEIESLIHLA